MLDGENRRMQGLTWVGALIGVREGAVGKSEGRVVGDLGDEESSQRGVSSGLPMLVGFAELSPSHVHARY